MRERVTPSTPARSGISGSSTLLCGLLSGLVLFLALNAAMFVPERMVGGVTGEPKKTIDRSTAAAQQSDAQHGVERATQQMGLALRRMSQLVAEVTGGGAPDAAASAADAASGAVVQQTQQTPPVFALACGGGGGLVRECAGNCVSPPVIGAIEATAAGDYAPRDVALEVVAGESGWVRLRSVASGRFISLRGGGQQEQPGWIAHFVAKDRMDSEATLVKLELDAEQRLHVRSKHTGGFVRCVASGLIRTHGEVPDTPAADRSEQTAFTVVELNAADVERDDVRVHSQRDAMTGGASFVVVSPPPVRAAAAPPAAAAAAAAAVATPIVPAAAAQAAPSGTASVPASSQMGMCIAPCPSAWEPCSALPVAGSGSAPSPCGYPGVAFKGVLGSFVCPSMFRDLSDYVWSFPFSHFKESTTLAPREVASICLPRIPLIYTQTDAGHVGSLLQWSRTIFKRPYILLTGQSDYPNPSTMRGLLNDPNLVHWFGQNQDESHAKFSSLPIGLNCFEHAPEMAAVLKSFVASGKFPAKKTDKLALVNFGDTHGGRKAALRHFCEGPNAKWTSCVSKTVSNNIQGNPHLKEFYRTNVATHAFVIAPRGNGLDTHRVWEALYLRTIPITLHSSIDSTFDDLPVLIVSDWSEVTKELLAKERPRLEAMFGALPHFGDAKVTSLPKLTRRWWLNHIEHERESAIEKLGETEDGGGGAVGSRHRCWEG